MKHERKIKTGSKVSNRIREVPKLCWCLSVPPDAVNASKLKITTLKAANFWKRKRFKKIGRKHHITFFYVCADWNGNSWLNIIYKVSTDVLNIAWEEANNRPPKHISFLSRSCLKDISEMAREKRHLLNRSPIQLNVRIPKVLSLCFVSSLKHEVQETHTDLCKKTRTKARIFWPVTDALTRLWIRHLTEVQPVNWIVYSADKVLWHH